MTRGAIYMYDISEEKILNNKNKQDDIDIKIKELLKFQYNMIAKLNDVIKKIDNINF